MAFCKKCGKQIDETTRFCPCCGTDQTANTFAQDPYAPDPNLFYTPQPPKGSGELNILHLIWAILNLISCCTPLGIASLILVILAKDAPTAESEQSKIKAAKTCNIIGTVSAIAVVLAYFIFYLLIVVFAIGITF